MIVISPNLVANPSASDRPLRYARIGWQTYTRDAGVTATATSATAAGPADAVLRPDTYEFWRPATGTATITIDLGQARDVDYVGIGGHTLQGATVTVQRSNNGSTWVSVTDPLVPSDNSALMFLFEEVTARYWRVVIDAATNPAIAVINVGKALAMQRGIYGGITPLTMARNTDIRPNFSETGQFLGRRIVSRGLDWSASWQHLEPTWYRENMEPFVKSARRFPFFLAWRPETFPAEVAYCWSTGDIVPTNMGIGRGLMEVDISLNGLGPLDA